MDLVDPVEQAVSRTDLLMMHRNKIQRTILPINMRDQLAYLSLQLGTIAQRRTRHLDQHHPPSPLGILLQQLLKRFQLLHDSLDHIQLVPTHDDLLALVEREETLELRLDARAVAAS